MFAQILAALSMYAVCRLLDGEWRWSIAAALAYGFAPYAFAHRQHHLDLTFYWHVPLCLLVTRWLSVSEGLPMRGAKFLFAIAVGFVTGLQNQYYTFMFIQLAARGGLAQWVRRGWSAFLPALAVCASSMLGFLVVSLDAIVFQFVHGRNPGAIVRNYGDIEFYALKLVDLFIPFPGDRLFSALGAATLVLVALLDQTPPIVSRRQIEQTKRAVDSDRTFTKEMESRLPLGSMVFQLPVVDFPEAFPGACYDHFRPYLFAQHLRFSYGAVKGRARDEWVHALNSVSAAEAIGILKRYGFAAIYVDRAQYQDQRKELFKGFTKMGMSVAQSPRGDLFCVFLNSN